MVRSLFVTVNDFTMLDEAEATDDTTVVFHMKQWDKGQQVIFEANPDYYGEAPKMKHVTVLFMEEDAAFAAVQAGQADLYLSQSMYSGSAVHEHVPLRPSHKPGQNLPLVLRMDP